VPVSYDKATPPKRLNWIRSQVIDRGMGCAFFATPQSYRETLAAYVKKTGYCMEQWRGRMPPPIVLPCDLEDADVMAVARIHFPDLTDPYLKLIAGRATQTESYFKNIELCVKRARFLAGERGHRSLLLDDIKEAIEYTMPAALTPSGRAAEATAKPATKPAGKAAAKTMQPVRNITPAVTEAMPESHFPRRGTQPAIGKLETVLAG